MTNSGLHPVDSLWPRDVAHLTWDKKTARRKILSTRDALSAESRRKKSAEFRKHLQSFLEQGPFPLSSSKVLTLSLFLPFGSEIDTAPIIPSLFGKGYRILLPALAFSDELTLLPWSAEISLRPGPFGILEPRTGNPVPPEEVDLFLVPGVGFDPRGHRLGYGRGYFDRLLSPPGVKGFRVGLSFSEQVVHHIPTTERDVSMNWIVSDKGSFPCD